jgi:replicative DNA helicase
LILAPPEGGKSITLQDFTMAAVLSNYRAAFITIEMTPEQVAYRFDSRLTQMRYRGFRRAQLSDEMIVAWDSAASLIKENMLKIIGVPEGCNCRLIESELAQLSGVFMPDIIAVDYASIMSPNEGMFGSSMDWKYVGEIVRNLKGLALKLNIPTWSAAQLLVGAKEKAEVSFIDVGLARQQIAAHADICAAVIQTSKMRAMDITRIQLVKVREGCENRFLEITSDFDRIKLERECTAADFDAPTVREEDEA